MALIPESPNRGESIPSGWGRRVAAALRENRVVAGPGLALSRTPSGTVIRLADSASRGGGGPAAAGTVPITANPCQIAEAVADGRLGPAKCTAYRLGAGGQVEQFVSSLYCMSAAETGGLPADAWVVGYGGALSAFAAVIPDDLEEEA
ncbi:MAG: hypothetical protein IJ678_00975 [Kiritimatiellae bacterium]|nr:hypothetical protein [Kiritimatiellia bacterium]